MTAHSVIFKELSYVFIAAILGGALAWRLRQPLILGYVLAGIFISPFTPGPAVREAHTFQIIAEVGVVFLMFSIGLEFSLDELLEVKWVSLIGAPAGRGAVGAAGRRRRPAAGLGRAARPGDGHDHLGRQYHGAVAPADRQRQLQSQHGKVMIGITLVEDLVVVVLTILMPVLASLTPHHRAGRGAGAGQGGADPRAHRISRGVPGAARAGADCALQ